ncbi:MAG: hypothetical protein B6244_09045 [Candidatus Cloacimonetes bacterium 4572_55]|nr:MAG: hypothetical protein B6244_09045 [Candidatus Cloacimonetes bacterium 4572_55]
MSYKTALRLLFILLSIVSTGCYPPDQEESSDSSEPSGGTVVIAMKTDIDNFNPILSTLSAASDIQGLIYLNLLRRDVHFKLHTSDYRPCLTKSWRFSEDFLELTLILRSDITWSDGVPVTAHDVKFTFDKMTDPNIPCSNRSHFDLTEECIVKGDYEVTFRFKEVYSNELDDVNIITPLPSHIFGDISAEEFINHDYNQNPTVVNGHYRVKRWERQQMIELTQNDMCSFQKPNLDRIVFRIIPDAVSRVTNLKIGDVDIVPGLLPEQAEEIKKNHADKIQVLSYSGMSFDYIAWLERHPIFSDREMRRALTMSINRREIVDALLMGYGKECISPIHPAYKEIYHKQMKPIPYDPEQAKKIFHKAGWRDSNDDGILDKEGEKFSFSMKTGLGNSRRRDALTMIQNDLKQVGIEMRQDMVEFSVMITQLKNREYDAALSGFRMGIVNHPKVFWHSSAMVGGFNRFEYSNPKVDSLIDLGRRTLDRDKAKKIWYEFQEILYADQPVTFMYILNNLDGVSRRVKGIETWPLGINFNPEEWWINDPSDN